MGVHRVLTFICYKAEGVTQGESIWVFCLRTKVPMNFMEKSMLLDELFALRKADKEEQDRFLEKLDRMADQLLSLNESSQAQTKIIDELKRMITDRDALIDKLQKENVALKEQKKPSRGNRCC